MLAVRLIQAVVWKLRRIIKPDVAPEYAVLLETSDSILLETGDALLME